MLNDNYDLENFLDIIAKEFYEGDKIVSASGPYVTVFGSARIPSDDLYYNSCYEMAKLLSNEGHNLITGGGPGIMEAANKGAIEGKSNSVGLNIHLPYEQTLNPYQTHSYTFQHFFTRKVLLAKYSYLFLVLPGGFGTLDEICEIITLMQTKKTPIYDVVFFGKEFWGDFTSFIRNRLLDSKLIDAKDIDNIILTNSIQDVLRLAKNGKLAYMNSK